MKVVFIIDQVYLHGGIERVLSIKANYLSNLKEYEIFIVTTEQKFKKPCYEFNSNIIFEDIEINYHRNKSYFHPINLLKIPRHIKKISKTLNNIKPDIVVVCSHSADTYFMPFVAKHISKIKEFHYSKVIEIEKKENPTSIFKRLFFKFADYVETKYNTLIVLNPDEATYYNSNNTLVIPNPLTFFPETTSKLENNIVISAGRIAPVKRFDVLIDIWELVQKNNNTLQLHIYGDGEKNYVQQLQKKIIDKNLTESIYLKGATDNIQEKMLNAALFVMTSDNECFPLVLLEAQACGLPIVSFDCPNGPRNIINSDNGVLIPMGKNQEFAESITNMLENPPKLKMFGSNARTNASKYQVDSVMKQWIAMFNTLKK
ncbi:glycosyltransferase family 4 protein [Mariniflexile jejuense]|uniref:Glycosyltransferase family 4 protein n=1 Tax=Mariniflexile jejuense TaxID=1173582 RepID=A0ABW3JEC9_9FLAO